MNKKKLSVVMAGAMLASSVAPVLAVQANNKTLDNKAENDSSVSITNLVVNNNATDTDNKYQLNTTDEKEYEVNGSNRGELVRQLRNLMKSKVYTSVSDNNVTGMYLSSNKQSVNHNFGSGENQSAYMVYFVDARGTVKTFTSVTEDGIKAMEEAVNSAPKGTIIRVIDRGFVEHKGNIYKKTQEEKTITESKGVWTEPELKELAKLTEGQLQSQYPAIADFDWDGKQLIVTTRRAGNELECEKTPVLPGSEKLDYKKPINKDGGTLVGRPWNSDWSILAGFEKDTTTTTVPVGQVIDAKLLASVTISDVTSKEIVKLSDLYDGLLLTEKGTELLEALKYEYKSPASENALPNSPNGGNIEAIKAAFKAGTKDIKLGKVGTVNSNKNGIFTLDISLETYDRKVDKTRDDNKLLETKVITVSSNNKSQLELFRIWMYNRRPQVDVLAGDNRYETAVKIAKDNANITDVAENGNIVLVNGNALVDGLAAAPLAASVWNKEGQNGNKVAPILLTETNSIPKATKAYMKELIAEQKVGDLNKVTIYLVGGTSVISKSVENDLKEIGFRVIRAGGDNREETSLKVAEVMKKDGNLNQSGTSKVDKTSAFIVGAEGEADAMSIAAVAAQKGTPIIVSKKGGLSEEAIDTLVEWKNENSKLEDQLATIVGGKTVVPEETVKALKAKGIQVDRVEGSNRQATNAAVITRYYEANKVGKIVVSKDGQRNKSELIDALTATSLAVNHKAPIVLGTNKLAYAQINALEQKAQRTGLYVYQVGHGVARDVLKAVADRFSLAK